MGATDISEPTEWSWGWSSLGGEETPGQRRKSNLSRSSFCAANCQSFEKTTQTKKKKPQRILRWGRSSVLLRCASHTRLVLVTLLRFGGNCIKSGCALHGARQALKHPALSGWSMGLGQEAATKGRRSEADGIHHAVGLAGGQAWLWLGQA